MQFIRIHCWDSSCSGVKGPSMYSTNFEIVVESYLIITKCVAATGLKSRLCGSCSSLASAPAAAVCLSTGMLLSRNVSRSSRQIERPEGPFFKCVRLQGTRHFCCQQSRLMPRLVLSCSFGIWSIILSSSNYSHIFVEIPRSVAPCMESHSRIRDGLSPG